MMIKLKASNPQLLQRLAQRMFVVVNKCDQMHMTEGQGQQETREYVAKILSEAVDTPGFCLLPEQVRRLGTDIVGQGLIHGPEIVLPYLSK
jgi:hypothetical protein